MIKLYLGLLLIALICNASDNGPAIGHDFLFTFINAEIADPPHGVLLYAIVSNNNNATASVSVTSPFPGFSTTGASIAPFSIYKILITPDSIENQYPGYLHPKPTGLIVIENKGIRLVSDQPVTVHAHAELTASGSADTFLVIPAVFLGTKYVAVTSTHPYHANMIAVVAYQDNTQISIGNQNTLLNALQVASVASMGLLSGTSISGNKPFGVVSGCTSGYSGSNGAGYEAVMLLPVGTWGTQFVAIPFMFLNTNWYQVLANTDNTVVSIGTTQTINLKAGEYVEFRATITVISSNNPVQLIQIGEQIGYVGTVQYGGGPFFLQLPNTNNMLKTSVLFQPTGFALGCMIICGKFYFIIRIVTNTAGIGTIQLNGVLINARAYEPVPNSDFYYYEAIVTSSAQMVTTTNPGTVFYVISYTYGSGYPLEGMGFACTYSLPGSLTGAGFMFQPTAMFMLFVIQALLYIVILL